MESKVVHKGKWLTFFEKNGYEYFERHRNPKAVVICAKTKDDEIIIVEQLRIPHNKIVFEPPAGLIDDGETAEQAAIREMLEETGYGNGKIVKIIENISSSPGICTETLTFIVIKGLEKISEGGGIEDENITTHIVPMYNIDNFIERKAKIGLIDMKLYTAIYLLKTI